MSADAKRNGGIVWVSEHVRDDRWPLRSGQGRRNLKRVWWDAEPVDYPSARGPSTVARYHADTDLILIAENGNLTTCIPLSHRPIKEQQFILSQVTDL